ncbi:MAG: ferritin-like domain-containing protein [Bacteroidetes bacterium]|nr:ferritin-like domain-containing protein [Bacteroidota bacterium]
MPGITAPKKKTVRATTPSRPTSASRKPAPGSRTSQSSSGSRTGQSSSGSRTGQPSRTRQSLSSSRASESSKLEELFIDELKDIYWAEKQLVKTLPRLKKAATSDELRQAFDNHTTETQGHVQRLEQAFEMLGKKAQAKKCDAMQGITEEGQEVIEDTDKGTSTRDVGLIMAGQKAEHYEIATYGSLIQIAKTLGHNNVARLLQQTLEEEKKADQLLTQIAESTSNRQAAGEKEEE